MNKLKPSIQSLEGKLTAGSVVTLLPIIAWLVGIDFNQANADKMMEAAKTVEEIAKAYQLAGGTVGEIVSLAKLIAILLFLYALIRNFTNKRVEIKKFFKDEVQ